MPTEADEVDRYQHPVRGDWWRIVRERGTGCQWLETTTHPDDAPWVAVCDLGSETDVKEAVDAHLMFEMRSHRGCRQAITATLLDMIQNSTGCTCCGSLENHADLIMRMLARFPVELWPQPEELSAAVSQLYLDSASYNPILEGLMNRRVAW